MTSEYRIVRDAVSQKSMDELLVQIQTLSVQLRKAVADYDLRAGTFYLHIDHVRKVIALTRQVKKSYSESRIKDFEKAKSELRSRIDSLRKEIIQLHKNISIEKTDKDVAVRLEKEVQVDLSRLKDMTLTGYRLLKEDSEKVTYRVKEKMQKQLSGDETSLEKQEKAVVIAKMLIDLVDRLDLILNRVHFFIADEEKLLSKLYLEKNKSINPDELSGIESNLNSILQELLVLLKDEKQRVHDPFMKLIDEQREGIEVALELISQKRLPWWKKPFRKSPKITVEDIQRSMYNFTELHEYHSFFSALKSHPELLDEKAKTKLDYLCGQALSSFGSLKGKAYKDNLTQIYNRNYFEDKFMEVIKKKSQFSFLILDIDHFKKFNDTHGHLTGDLVLKSVAKLMQKCTRVYDVPGRWGGEEMVVLLPRTDLADAKMVCERIRATIEKYPNKNVEGEDIEHITVSGGLIHFGEVDSNLSKNKSPKILMEEIMSAADKLLYKAKKDGRNRIYAEELYTFSAGKSALYA